MHPSDNGISTNKDVERDLAVGSLKEPVISTSNIPEPPSLQAVPFQPPWILWEDRNHASHAISIPEPPIAPLSVPVIPPQQISKERFEDKNNLDYFSSCESSFDITQGASPLLVSCDTTCEVCFEPTSVQLSCCSAYVCEECTYNIIVVNVNDGVTSIPCPSPECDQLLMRDDILKLLNSRNDLGTKDKYERFRLAKSSNDKEKVCPRCSWLTTIGTNKKPRRWKEADIHLTCEKCSLEWCFKCHAPWHTDISCKQFKRGNKDFRKWIVGKDLQGNANCQLCPSCKIPIQQDTGCNFIICSNCNCVFCYRCGCQYYGNRYLRELIGYHSSTLGFGGCKYNYKPNNSIKRVLVRGGYLFSKVSSVLGYPGLLIASGAILLLAGVIIVPVVYVAYKMFMRSITKKVVSQDTKGQLVEETAESE